MISLFRNTVTGLSLIALMMLMFQPALVVLAQENVDANREVIDRTQNVIFYDVNPQSDYSCYTGAQFPFGSDLYFVGDSIGVGLFNGGLREKLPETWAINEDVVESRFLSGGFATTGQEVLERDLQPGGPASDARIVVVQLGTNNNGNVGNFQEQVDETVDLIRQYNPAATIVWVDSPATYDPDLISGINGAIQTVANEKNVQVFSLFEVAYPNGENGTPTNIRATSSNTYAATDNIHLTTAGYDIASTALAQWLTANINATSNSSFSASSTIQWPADLDPEWIRIWTSVGAQYGVDPKILAAIFTSEHGGRFYPISGDGGTSAQGGWRQPSSSTATGPFQFLNDAWDWMTDLDPTLPPRTNRGPTDPRNDPTYASRGAALYIRFMGAPEGLPAGDSATALATWERVRYGDSTANTEQTRFNSSTGNLLNPPWTVADIAARYNQGPWWGGGEVQGNNDVVRYMDTAVATYLSLGGQSAVSGNAGCDPNAAGGGNGTVQVINGGNYSFPIEGTKATIQSGYLWPCSSICHHDNTPAFDLSHEYDDSSIGVAVFAITDGRIANFRTSYRGEEGCNSFQIVGDDGWWYWHGHVQVTSGISDGLNVSAGQQVAVIGERRCTGNGSYPHLHIDRGSPQGRAGGSDCCRDQGFVPLINQLYGDLP